VAAVTVQDTQAPEITHCPTNRIIVGGMTPTSMPDLVPELVATDCSGSVVVTQNPPPGTPITNYPTLVTLYAADASNNTNTCTASVMVIDSTAAVLSWLGAYVQDGQAIVAWETVSEQGWLAFEVYRTSATGGRELITAEPQWAEGRAFGRRYTVPDAAATLPGVFSYELVGWRDSGVMETLATVTVRLLADASVEAVRLGGLQLVPGGVRVGWSGGAPPYELQFHSALSPNGSWIPVGPAQPGDTEMIVPLDKPEGYFRVLGGQR
jgi:hypothetical protein